MTKTVVKALGPEDIGAVLQYSDVGATYYRRIVGFTRRDKDVAVEIDTRGMVKVVHFDPDETVIVHRQESTKA